MRPSPSKPCRRKKSMPCRDHANHSGRGSTSLYSVASSQDARPCSQMALSVSSSEPSRSRENMKPPCSLSTLRGNQNGTVLLQQSVPIGCQQVIDPFWGHQSGCHARPAM